MGLYPTFDLPKLTTDSKREDTTYKPSLHFDFEAGDFVLDGAHRAVWGTGKDAFCEWCLKVCATERGTRLAYSDKIGVEIQKAARESTDVASLKSAIERTITEALLVNPATQYVKDFEFESDGDHLYVTFTVVAREFGEETLRVIY